MYSYISVCFFPVYIQLYFIWFSLDVKVFCLPNDQIVKCMQLYVICFLLGNSPAGNYPKENILHTEHGESLKSSMQL